MWKWDGQGKHRPVIEENKTWNWSLVTKPSLQQHYFIPSDHKPDYFMWLSQQIRRIPIKANFCSNLKKEVVCHTAVVQKYLNKLTRK